MKRKRFYAFATLFYDLISVHFPKSFLPQQTLFRHPSLRRECFDPVSADFFTSLAVSVVFQPFIRQCRHRANHKAVHFVFGDSFLLRHNGRMSQKSNVPYPVSTIPFPSFNSLKCLESHFFQPFRTTERICEEGFPCDFIIYR